MTITMYQLVFEIFLTIYMTVCDDFELPFNLIKNILEYLHCGIILF